MKYKIEKFVIDLHYNQTQTQWLVQEKTNWQHMPWKTIAVFNDEPRAEQYVNFLNSLPAVNTPD